jgi:hypothetical protein
LADDAGQRAELKEPPAPAEAAAPKAPPAAAAN